MDAGWRHFLYYTLGLLPPLFFGLRFLVQWISSEKQKRSHVNKAFWRLSLCGNLLLSTHYFVQMQFLLFLLQIANGFISWRNLNLLTGQTKINFKRSLILLLSLLTACTLLFLCQSQPFHILEVPAGLKKENISQLWHLFGSAGCILFASRFWLQWIQAERTGESRLSKSFWLLSIIGSLSALAYFLHIKDWVSCLNYCFGLIPYIRNLMLLKLKHHKML